MNLGAKKPIFNGHHKYWIAKTTSLCTNTPNVCNAYLAVKVVYSEKYRYFCIAKSFYC